MTITWDNRTDNSYWIVSGNAFGPGLNRGIWVPSGSYWKSEDVGGAQDSIYLLSQGAWTDSYRPTHARFTFDKPSLLGLFLFDKAYNNPQIFEFAAPSGTYTMSFSGSATSDDIGWLEMDASLGTWKL
jgi:hypothetical protein